MIRIGLILNSPSPHQVELLNAVARRPDVDAFVGFAQSHNPARHWGRPTPDLPWENLPTGIGQMLTGSLDRWIKSHRADVWLLSSVYTSPATHLLTRSLRRHKQKFAFLGEPPRPQQGLRNWIRGRLMMSVLRRAHAIIGTGREAARRYQTLSAPHQSVASIPYYIDVTAQLEKPGPTVPSPTEPFRFVTSAQLIHRKGLDVLIAACQQLPQTGWSLDIYGDGPLRQKLTLAARAANRPVRFRGLLPYDQKDEVFKGKHCFVFSTRWDGWGMVLPEALAMGLPVITTDQAMSAHDFIVHGVNGQIGPADNADFLAGAMRSAILSRETLPEQSRAARTALADYTPDAGACQLTDFLSLVAAKAA